MATTLTLAGNADFNGDLDVDGTTNLDVVDIDGALTQDGGAVFNEGSADVDFRVESNGNANMVFVDGGNDRVVIGSSNVSGASTLAVAYPQAKTDTSTRYVHNWQSNEASGQFQ